MVIPGPLAQALAVGAIVGITTITMITTITAIVADAVIKVPGLRLL